VLNAIPFEFFTLFYCIFHFDINVSMGNTDLLKENCVIMTTDYYYNTEWKCVEERDSGETCPRKQYAYGIRGRNDLVARDNYHYNSSSSSPSCSSTGKERHYALNDAMGSVTAVASTAGAIVERYSYTAFGKSQVMDASFADRSLSSYDWQTRYHGEQRDAETGFYNYGYRYYDPVTGRWPSRDPLGDIAFLLDFLDKNDAKGKMIDLESLLRKEINSGNLYHFVHNAPLASIDFLGLADCDGKASATKCCYWTGDIAADSAYGFDYGNLWKYKTGQGGSPAQVGWSDPCNPTTTVEKFKITGRPTPGSGGGGALRMNIETRYALKNSGSDGMAASKKDFCCCHTHSTYAP
jgi:RHS repeat-associated protein